MDFGTLWDGFWKGFGRPKSSILALFSPFLLEKSYQKSSEKKNVEKNRKKWFPNPIIIVDGCFPVAEVPAGGGRGGFSTH